MWLCGKVVGEVLCHLRPRPLRPLTVLPNSDTAAFWYCDVCQLSKCLGVVGAIKDQAEAHVRLVNGGTCGRAAQGGGFLRPSDTNEQST